MKKRNIILIILTIVIIIACFVFMFSVLNNKNKKEEIVEISLDELENKIENTDEFDFTKMQELDVENASAMFLVDSFKIKSLIGKVPIVNTKASMYVIIQADEDNLQDIKLALESYGTEYETQWKTYLPDQYELVKNREIGIISNYVYMIVSENPDKIVKLIK